MTTTNDFGLADGVYVNDYAIESESSGTRYPHIQADNYLPSNLKAIIRLGSPNTALELLPVESPLFTAVDFESFMFGDDGEETTLGLFNGSVRWIVLFRPKIFGLVKAENRVVPLLKGLKERGEVTVSQLLLGCVVDDVLILDNDGKPQVFTLKLKSSKTSFVGKESEKDAGQERNNGHRTIAQLNKAIVNKSGGKSGQWMAHTVSVEIGAVPEKFTNADGKSSWGIRFVFPVGSVAKPLNAANSKAIFELVTSDEFKEFATDPFGLAKKNPIAEAPQNAAPTGEWTDEDGMPF